MKDLVKEINQGLEGGLVNVQGVSEKLAGINSANVANAADLGSLQANVNERFVNAASSAANTAAEQKAAIQGLSSTFADKIENQNTKIESIMKVSERSERAFGKTQAMKCSKLLQSATSTTS